MNCFDCSQASLYPDGALRCDLDMHLCKESCVWHNYGNPKICRGEKLEVPEKKPRAIVKSKSHPKKAVKSKKPKLQGMFDVD